MHVWCLVKPLWWLNECLHVLTFVFSSLCFTLPTHKSVTDIYSGPSVDAWERTSQSIYTREVWWERWYLSNIGEYCIVCTLTASTLLMLFAKCSNFQKGKFSKNIFLWKDIRKIFRNIENSILFYMESSKLINYSTDMCLKLPLYCSTTLHQAARKQICLNKKHESSKMFVPTNYFDTQAASKHIHMNKNLWGFILVSLN
jgi:hypothetical protein